MTKVLKLGKQVVAEKKLELAITHSEEVLARVIDNISKNLTGAQAMKGNADLLVSDIIALKALRKNLVEDDATQPKAKAPAKKTTEPKATVKPKTPTAQEAAKAAAGVAPVSRGEE